jgi:hypothetical protein
MPQCNGRHAGIGREQYGKIPNVNLQLKCPKNRSKSCWDNKKLASYPKERIRRWVRINQMIMRR